MGLEHGDSQGRSWGCYQAGGEAVKGVLTRQTSQLKRWDPATGFVDAQLQGPYQLWQHTHRVESHRGGTRMTDVVR
jgi:hypothetical protein